MTEAEYQQEIGRLRGIIATNKASFLAMKTELKTERERRIAAEAALKESRRGSFGFDPDLLNMFGGRK